MNGVMLWLARFVVERARLAAVLASVAIVALSWLAGEMVRAEREDSRLRQLGHEADRRSIELMSKTLNGGMMGSLSLLGLIDPEIKVEAREAAKPGYAANSPRMTGVLESVGRAYGAEGVFLVTGNGVVASSWDSSGKPSTGVDVAFRPYHQMAMQGRENVYAAISLARGDRALYFAAPIYAGNRKEGAPVGTITGRSGVGAIDQLLRKTTDTALLLSPQGVVFASSRNEWVGSLAGVPSVERLKAIRELRQFGNLFDKTAPPTLPFDVDDGLQHLDGQRIAVAGARVEWNDPSGDWRLVLVEDLARTIPVGESVAAMALTAFALLFGGGLLHGLLRGQYLRQQAARQIKAYARAQEAAVVRKEMLATASLRLQQARTTKALAQAFLSEAHELLGALQGVVYVAGDDGLRLTASYAGDDTLPATLAPGEGLLGQCAVDRQLRVLTAVPTGFATIRSGLGETAPAAAMMAPLVLKDTLLGVAEIAVLKVPDDAAREQFEDLLRLFAMNLEIVGFSAREHAPEGAVSEPQP